MSLAKELFGLSAIIVLAIYVNRLLIINGFKRDPHSTDKEMPIENQSCQFVEFDSDDEGRVSVRDIFVTEDLAFMTAAERETILMFDLTEDLTDYDLPLFESTKVRIEKTFPRTSNQSLLQFSSWITSHWELILEQLTDFNLMMEGC